MFSLICTRINGWVNNGEAGDLRHHGAHYDVIVMAYQVKVIWFMKKHTQLRIDDIKMSLYIPLLFNLQPVKLYISQMRVGIFFN